MIDDRQYCTWTNAISERCSNLARFWVVYLLGTGRIEKRVPRCNDHLGDAITFVRRDTYPYWFKAVEPVA